jgi:hypothetical protein
VPERRCLFVLVVDLVLTELVGLFLFNELAGLFVLTEFAGLFVFNELVGLVVLNEFASHDLRYHRGFFGFGNLWRRLRFDEIGV